MRTGQTVSRQCSLESKASFDSPYLPHDWRTANLILTFKKGDRQNLANYRPVSLTSISCKTLEHIVYLHLITHFEENNILSDIQHGSRKRRGCDTQLQIDLVILDF